jgi:hypothetical protein
MVAPLRPTRTLRPTRARSDEWHANNSCEAATTSRVNRSRRRPATSPTGQNTPPYRARCTSCRTEPVAGQCDTRKRKRWGRSLRIRPSGNSRTGSGRQGRERRCRRCKRSTQAALRAPSERTEVDGVPLHLIGRADLLENKRASARTRDLADVEALQRQESRKGP